MKDDPIACKQVTAYIPDNPDLYGHLTGVQYLNFIGDMFGVKKVERESLVKRYADEFELTRDLGSLISSYSCLLYTSHRAG